MALGHDIQDASKTMRISTLFTAGGIETFDVPFEAVLAAGAVAAAAFFLTDFLVG